MARSSVPVTDCQQQTAIMLFARVPAVGAVKTRLIPALGAHRACRLHRAMLQRSLEALAQTTAAERQLWLAGDSRHQVVDIARPSDGLHVHWQQGADIGERMAQAFQQNFRAGWQHVVVAGSDCPQLTGDHYEQVLVALERHDAVIIPALDGGYVLLGLNRWDASLFVDVPWGTAAVLRTTVARLESLGWSWYALPGLPDIDRAEDLVHLQGLGLDY